MAVTIKKGFPVKLPPWRRVFDPVTFIYSYIPFDWSKKLLFSDATLNMQDGNNWREVPIFQGSNQFQQPMAYPRCYLGNTDGLASIFDLLQSNNIFPYQPSGEAGFLFTDGLEVNGKDTVMDADGNPHIMPSTVNNRWQGGDALFMNVVVLGPIDNPAEVQWYTQISASFPSPPYAVAAPDMIAHDQGVVNSVISAFQRVLFLYFFQRADTPTGTDRLQEAADVVSGILESAVAGISNAEYHRTQTLADTATICVAKAKSFFGV